MIDWVYPVTPMIHHLTPDSPVGIFSCPMRVSSEDGSRGGASPGNDGPPVAVSQFYLKNYRRRIIDDAHKYLTEEALRMAVRLIIIKAGTTLGDIDGWPEVSDRVPSMQTQDGRKALAAVYLMTVTKNLASLVRMDMAKRPVDVNQLEVIACLSAQRGCLAGLLAAIAVGVNQTAARGAVGRRKQGDATKARVQLVADGLRGRMSKEAAAVKVAQTIGKSTSTVRRLLSELYPGTSWVISAS
jgi:hypothetical protein